MAEEAGRVASRTLPHEKHRIGMIIFVSESKAYKKVFGGMAMFAADERPASGEMVVQV